MLVPNRARRLLLAAVLTASFAGLACGSASAIELSVGEAGFRAVWTPMRFIVNGSTLTCNLTLEGSFHRTAFAKVERSLVGYVTRATGCSSGLRVLTETLPWHVQYGSFSGTLPNISAMTLRVIGMSVGFTIIELRCLARSEASTPALLIAERSEAGTIASFRWDESTVFPLTGTSCTSFRARLGGTGSVVGQSSGRAISLTLIGEPATLSPSPVEFGVVEAEAVVSRNVTITAGTSALEVSSISLAGGTSFARLDPNRCIGSTLPARSTCVFKAIFAAPRETGRSFEDTVSVGTNAGTLNDSVRAST